MFLPLPWLFAFIVLQDFLNQSDIFFSLLDGFCAVTKTSQWRILTRTVSQFRSGSDTAMLESAILVFLIFSLCVESSAFFISTCLPLYYSFIQVAPPFENCSLFLCCPIKYPQIQFSLPFTEKKKKKHTECETAKLNIPNLIRG